MLVSLYTNALSADLTINAQLSITDLHMLGFGKCLFLNSTKPTKLPVGRFFQPYSRAATAKLDVLWLPYLSVFIFYLYIIAFTFLL